MDEPRRIALVCLEPSLHGALLSIEPFRAANRLSRSPLFHVDFISADGQPTRSIMDIAIPATATLYSATYMTWCCSIAPTSLGARRALFSDGFIVNRPPAPICALDTAPLLLAAAGLLKGFKATSHWSALASFRELYPDTEVVGAGVCRRPQPGHLRRPDRVPRLFAVHARTLLRTGFTRSCRERSYLSDRPG